MMGLVNHAQIPASGHGVVLALRVGHQESQAAKNQLLALEGVGGAGCLITLGIEQAETQVETPAHLDQPLVQQGFGRHDQHPVRPPGQQLLMHDQTRFDGFAKTDLIGQQNPW